MGGLLRHDFFSVTTCFRFVFCFGICSLIRRRGPAFRLFLLFSLLDIHIKAQHNSTKGAKVRHPAQKQTNPHTVNGWAVPVVPEEWCREYPHKGKEEEQQQKKNDVAKANALMCMYAHSQQRTGENNRKQQQQHLAAQNVPQNCKK